jgi:hypothetical protein
MRLNINYWYTTTQFDNSISYKKQDTDLDLTLVNLNRQALIEELEAEDDNR